jgi:hypothetical protein
MNSNQLFREENEKVYLLHPETGTFLLTEDKSEEFKKISQAVPHNKAAEQAFLEHKLVLAQSLAGDYPEQVKEFTDKTQQVLGDNSPKNVDTPPPGGVGYGAMYKSAFKVAYNSGASIASTVICPTKVAGNVNTWFYLTSTNRTAKGVEAFISYYSQEDFYFKVFDWSKDEDDRWQLAIPKSNLGDYLHQKTINNVSYQVIILQNITSQISNNLWNNIVYLYKPSTDSYVLVYSSTYNSSENEQKGDWVGSWGPIVETFQASYTSINTVGFDLTYLQGKDSSGVWSGWQLLTNSLSDIRNDGVGFTVVFLNPNYAYAVH